MAIDQDAYQDLKAALQPKQVALVAVSKTKSPQMILELYDLGQRDFGENYVQEMLEKQLQLPKDIRWHYIGHLQSNKVKQVIPFVQLIQSVDSLKLLAEINKQGAKQGRKVNCLLQVYIAKEETKFGMSEEELDEAMKEASSYDHVNIQGLMGMASFTTDMEGVRKEFQYLHQLFDGLAIHHPGLSTISMGMSQDYRVAIEEGSNMIRIGSLLFGEREKKTS